LKNNTIDFADEKINYHTSGDGPILLFMHGYATTPIKYSPILDLLSQDYNIIAPEIYGLNIFNNQPISIEDYAILTKKFMHRLGIEDCLKVGHSTGGAVLLNMNKTGNPKNTNKSIALNPIMPTNFKHPHLDMPKIVIQLTLKYDLGFTDLLNNTLKDIPSTLKFASNVSNLGWDNFDVNEESLVVYSVFDEFYKGELEEKKQQLSKFSKIELKIISDTHMWLLENPQKAKMLIDDYFGKELDY